MEGLWPGLMQLSSVALLAALTLLINGNVLVVPGSVPRLHISSPPRGSSLRLPALTGSDEHPAKGWGEDRLIGGRNEGFGMSNWFGLELWSWSWTG